VSEPPWVYRVEALVKLTDGDTLVLRVRRAVDFGFRRHTELSSVEEFRLAGIDTPEPRGATRHMGERASQELRTWFDRPDGLVLESLGEDDKYGRWLARLICLDRGDVAQWLLRNGFAKWYSGKGPRPTWDPAAPYPLEVPQ
jgi:micrococcal nuclease